MEIEEALTQFQADKKGGYSAKDLDAISEVVSELSLSCFEIKLKGNVVTKSGKPYPIYIRDADDIVHFHPWMIVSKKRFKRCDPTQNSKYKTWPYFLMLDGWIQAQHNLIGRSVQIALLKSLQPISVADANWIFRTLIDSEKLVI